MCHNVFIYGSLMFVEVYKGVTGVEPTFIDAKLSDFKRYALQGNSSTYPAMIPQAGACVKGKLVMSVSDEQLAVLDRFEELDLGLYSRERVWVESANGLVEAEAYIAGDSLRPQLKGEWDPENFESLWLQDYLLSIVEEFKVDEAAR